MLNRKLLFFAVVSIVIVYLLSGCTVMGMQANLKPENLKHYKLKGAYMYGSVELPSTIGFTSVMIMFNNAPSLNINTHKDIEYFLIDVPFKCKGIVRIGVRYDDVGTIKEIWYNKPISFSVESNKINYLGNIVLTNIDNTQFMMDKIYITNYQDEDKDDFYSNYTSLTKYEFYKIESKL